MLFVEDDDIRRGTRGARRSGGSAGTDTNACRVIGEGDVAYRNEGGLGGEYRDPPDYGRAEDRGACGIVELDIESSCGFIGYRESIHTTRTSFDVQDCETRGKTNRGGVDRCRSGEPSRCNFVRSAVSRLIDTSFSYDR